MATWVDGRSCTLGSLLGLLAVGGLAVRSATTLLSGFQRVERDEPRLGSLAVVRRGTIERGMPTAAAALVVFVASLPLLAMGHVPGSEVVRPLAVSLLGGALAVTLLALVALPAGYLVVREHRLAGAEQPTLPLAWSSSSTAPSEVADDRPAGAGPPGTKPVPVGPPPVEVAAAEEAPPAGTAPVTAREDDTHA